MEKELKQLERKGERHLKPLEEFELTRQQQQELAKGSVAYFLSHCFMVRQYFTRVSFKLQFDINFVRPYLIVFLATRCSSLTLLLPA